MAGADIRLAAREWGDGQDNLVLMQSRVDAEQPEELVSDHEEF